MELGIYTFAETTPDPETGQAITASKRIRDLMANASNETAGLRIGVKNGGCAGMEYTMEWADKKSHLMKLSLIKARGC